MLGRYLDTEADLLVNAALFAALAAAVDAWWLASLAFVTATVLANLGLSTQLLVLGACLVLEAPEVYLWLALASLLVLPVLQLRRERLARRALAG